MHSAAQHLEKVRYCADSNVRRVTWFHRGLNLNVAKASHPQGTCEAISDACLHLSHPELFTRLTLNKFAFILQCPVSNPVVILSWVCTQVEQLPSFFFLRGFFFFFPLKKSHSLPLCTCGLPMLHTFSAHLVLDHPSGNFCRYTKFDEYM